MKSYRPRTLEHFSDEQIKNFTLYSKELRDLTSDAVRQLPKSRSGEGVTSYYRKNPLEVGREEISALETDGSTIYKRYFYSDPKTLSIEIILGTNNNLPTFEFYYEESSRTNTSYLELSLGARGNKLVTGGIVQGLGQSFVMAEYQNLTDPFESGRNFRESQFKIFNLKVFPLGGTVIIGRSLIHITPPFMSPITGRQPETMASDWVENTEIYGGDVINFFTSALLGHQDLDTSLLLPELSGVNRIDIRELNWHEPVIDLHFSDEENLD